MANPSKSEIAQIFKRLRSVQANKVCFDCGSNNPTWSSITYGIFICIDCSGIHRSLGVHLTFVRSTQLDSNWTWQQIRQMQCGGNSNATTFFRQHNCVTNDAQQKYKSRAAQLYREKLHQLAAQAMRLHGTKVFIDTAHNTPSVGDDAGEHVDAELVKEDDDAFFQSHTSDEAAAAAAAAAATLSETSSTTSSATSSSLGRHRDLAPGEGPSVEAALSATAAAKQPRKSTIGQRKPQAKKGLGAKKGGLGAQKVKKDFAEIEREAEMADQIRTRDEEDRRKEKERTKEDEEKSVASMRLAYQDLTVQQKKTDKKLRDMDPKKAAAVERLGMGMAANSASTNVHSHSAITEMSSIEQEEPVGRGKKSGGFRSSGRSKFDVSDDEEDFEVISTASSSGFGGFGGSAKNNDWRTSNPETSSGVGNWEKEFEVLKNTNKSSSSSSSKNDEWNNNFDDKRKPARPDSLSTSRSTASSEDAQKKFGGAKAISSDMYFGGNDANGGRDANLSRFQGSSSISSADYFGRNEVAPGSRMSGANITTPDYDEVKESVRQGVNKVAGRLSNMANGVMNQLQDRYGY